MASSIPYYQALYQNQLQFNLGVPLTTQNLAVQFHHPPPILVERISGQHAIPGKVPQGKETKKEQKLSGLNFSVLSEDKMELMTRLARRDLQNRQTQQKGKSSSSETVRSGHSPSRAQFYQRSSCSRLNRKPQNHLKKPLRASEAEKNRRLGAVQTPPSRKPLSHSRIGDDSLVSPRNEANICYPVKSVTIEGREAQPDEISILQQELEGHLHIIKTIADRAIIEGHTRFLLPGGKNKARAGFLEQEEDESRTKARVGEQNTRSARNIYNLRQKVKQLQRDIAHADLNKPVKKNQILSQLTSVHRGAVKSLQTFVQQLPHQDLHTGLPAHYQEMSILLRQLTALSSLSQQNKKEGSNRVLEILDTVDALNIKWCSSAHKSDFVQEFNDKKAMVAKDWVSDTKVNKDFGPIKFKVENMPQGKRLAAPLTKEQMSRGRSGRHPPGKENRVKTVQNERRSVLRTGIASLMNQKGYTSNVKQQLSALSGHKVAWEVNMRNEAQIPPHVKGYLLPSDLVVKRERAQRAVELSNQQRGWSESHMERQHHFAEPTISASIKSVSASRSSSAPTSPKKKEVNFYLGSRSPVPWIPAGSGSRSPRSRSLSTENRHEERNPVYVREMDKRDIREMFNGRYSHTDPSGLDKEIPTFGFQSLPTQERLRSHKVSDSLLDDLEERLYDRLVQRRVATNQSPPQGNKLVFEDNSSVINVTTETEGDSMLDITNLDSSSVGKEAAAIMDVPTLENVKLRLAEMQREQREIRQRWSSMKFADTNTWSRGLGLSVRPSSDNPRDPPGMEVTRLSRSKRPHNYTGAVNKEWTEAPLLFTKPAASTAPSVQFHHTVQPSGQLAIHAGRPVTVAGIHPPKTLLRMTQTAVEKIAANRDRFESYLRKRSHHPTGKFDPWKLVEEISDEILSDCLQEVAGEVEQINEEIANNMYKSEFMVDKTQPSLAEEQDSYFPVRADEWRLYSAGEVVNIGLKLAEKEVMLPQEKIDLFLTQGLNLGVGDVGDRVHWNVSGNRAVTDERPADSLGSVRASVDGSLQSQRSRVSSQQSLSPQCVKVAAEPDLEDVSNFLKCSEEMSGSIGENVQDVDHINSSERPGGGDHEEDYDENDYSDEDFEDVSDVEF